MTTTNLSKKIKELADHVDENYTDVESEGKDYDSDSTLGDSDVDQEIELVDKEIEQKIEPEIEPEEPVKKAKRKYTKRAPRKTLQTSDPNIQVEVKSKKKGPKKKIITIYKEDITPDKLVIREVIKRKPGRPRAQKDAEIIPDDDLGDVVVVPKPHPQKELTKKQLKELELHTKLAELQLISGNSKLKLNKKGAIDKRMLKTRSAAQLQATKNLVQLNAVRRQAKREAAKKEILAEQKNVVTNIITSLNEVTVVDNTAAEEKAQLKAANDAKTAAKQKATLSLFD